MKFPCLAVAFCCALVSGLRGETIGERTVDLRSDPNWEGYRNLLRPKHPQITRQDFGYHTNGANTEIGGWVNRSPTPAYWARVIPHKTLNDKLGASGTFRVARAEGGRTATSWNPGGPMIRVHIGLEDPDDLIADLGRGFAALAAAA